MTSPRHISQTVVIMYVVPIPITITIKECPSSSNSFGHTPVVIRLIPITTTITIREHSSSTTGVTHLAAPVCQVACRPYHKNVPNRLLPPPKFQSHIQCRLVIGFIDLRGTVRGHCSFCVG